jgi:hypothetical protein
MKNFYLIPISIFLFGSNNSLAQISPGIDSAYLHLKQQYEQYHVVSYVYNDDNSGGNIYIPSIWIGEYDTTDISMTQEYIIPPVFGRSCSRFLLTPDSSFSAVRYVYPKNNNGMNAGYNLTGVTNIKFKAKGNGVAEFLVGGTNRRPFKSIALQYQDGIDIRSTGFVTMDTTWVEQVINLTDSTFWVYKDSTQGANNMYCQPVYMDSLQYFHFFYGGNDGQGNTCMKLYWFGDYQKGAGVYLFPPEQGWTNNQGYDLTGITKIKFKAKISESGNVKFLFGMGSDSFTPQNKIIYLDTNWTSYEWAVTPGLNYTKVVGGFGFYVGGNLNTPKYSTLYIDSVYYEGVHLASSFSSVINGFQVQASKALNPAGAEIYIDEVFYDKERTDTIRFCQSYISGSDSIDITMKNKGDVYDNALTIIAYLSRYISDPALYSNYLTDAKHIGDAFIYSMNHDRHFTDFRLRNSYMCGELKTWDGIVKLPGWYNSQVIEWFEDTISLSTYTGNVAWAGIALLWLYQASENSVYLNAAKQIADWCLNKTQSSTGFKGGFIGPDFNQVPIGWKSTMDNIDLYALFTRLDSLSPSPDYDSAIIKARNFVKSMWNPTVKHFWTGTKDNGITINTDNPPLNIQACYLMAFKDWTSDYSQSILWANKYCYLQDYLSQNYNEPLNGFDFNSDTDGVGIWLEGSAQAAIANRMAGQNGKADSTITTIEYIQSNHKDSTRYNLNHKGIVAADHDYLSTGLAFNYHNRLSIGATCWYIFAKSLINPYFYPGDIPIGITPTTRPGEITLYQNYPNPFNNGTTIKYKLNKKSEISLIVYDVLGNKVRKLVDSKENAGSYQVIWDGMNDNGSQVKSGLYIYKLITNNSFQDSKFMILMK